MQTDCNLVVYDANDNNVWESGTDLNNPILPCRLMLQNDGKLAVINALDQPFLLQQFSLEKFSEIFGYEIGSEFEEYNSDYYIQQIIICSGAWIDGIQIQFSNGVDSYQTALHGGSGGGPSVFNIPSNEYISLIYVCYGLSYYRTYSILQLQFTTNKGKRSPLYGYYGGGICLMINLAGEGLAGIGGYSDDYLNGIEFYSKSEITSKVFALYGYPVGDEFTYIGNSSYRIQQINVRSSSLIDAIQLQFSNNYSTDFKGGTGGNLESFVIPSGQYISSIYICFAIFTQTVIQLQFKTNEGANSSLFGWDNGGTCKTINLPGGLSGIGGYNTNYVNGLYFYSNLNYTYSYFGCTYENSFDQTFSGVYDPETCFSLCSSGYNFFFLYKLTSASYCICNLIKDNQYPPFVDNDNDHEVCNSLCSSNCATGNCSYCGSDDGVYGSAYLISNTSQSTPATTTGTNSSKNIIKFIFF